MRSIDPEMIPDHASRGRPGISVGKGMSDLGHPSRGPRAGIRTTSPSFPVIYSARMASVGGMDAARTAGTRVAPRATARNMRDPAVRVMGSQGRTW